MTLFPDDSKMPFFEAACDLAEAGEVEGAAAMFRMLAENGDAWSRTWLADLLDDLDRPVEASVWYRRAVRAGYVVAAHNLAMLHRRRNRRRGYIHWLRVAAAMGDEEAPGLLEVATTRDDVWWAVEGVPPPSFVSGLRVVR